MNSPKLAFACIPFALLAPVFVSGLAPRANDAVVIAVDAFGRPVPGLELEVVLRGKDGKLTRSTEKPSAETGQARVKVGDKALADVNVKGDFDVAVQTSWKEGDTRHVLLTVVPLVPFEARFTKRDGMLQKDVAVLMDTPQWWRHGAPLNSDGEDVSTRMFMSDADGLVVGKAPRGSEDLTVVLPGSFDLFPEQSVPLEGYARRADAVPLHVLGHRFELHLPALAERPLAWVGADEAPIANLSWCALLPSLVGDEAFVERFSVESKADGVTTVLEQIDADGEFVREYNKEVLIRRGDDRFRIYVPPVPEDGVVGTLGEPPHTAAAPKAPAGFRWTWQALGYPDVRERVDAKAKPKLTGSDNFLWAAPIGRDDFDHVVRFDARIAGPLPKTIDCELVDTVVDLSSLPKARWSIESRTVLVDDENAYLDVNDNVVLDESGRAKTFGKFDVDYSELHPTGPGLASDRVLFEQLDEGVVTRTSDHTSLDVRFVRPDGSPAAFVSFIAQTSGPRYPMDGSYTLPAWSDEAGRATFFVEYKEGFTVNVQFRTHERLAASFVEVVVGADRTATVVVPDTGRLSIDGPKLVGGEPRPMHVRFTPYVEGVETEFDEQKGSSRPLLTNADGRLDIDDVPVGSYVFEISETTFAAPSLGGLHRVDVMAPKAQR